MGEGGNAMTTEQALANGFPPEIAKLIGGEPTDPKYARENVGVEAVEEPVVEPVQVEAEDTQPVVGSEKVEEAEQLSEKESETVEAPVSEPRRLHHDQPTAARQLVTMCHQNRVVLTSTPPKVLNDSLRFLTVTGCQIVTALRSSRHI